MAEGEDSDSAAVRLLPLQLQLQQPATLTLPLCQAAIEALDKRTRECGWAQKFCAAMAALQVPALPTFSRPAAHSPQHLKQEANQAHDGSAATAASREAQQLLQAVQADENFTMQVLPPPSPPPPPLAQPHQRSRNAVLALLAEQLAVLDAGAGGVRFGTAVARPALQTHVFTSSSGQL
jgi:hypothetical protein